MLALMDLRALLISLKANLMKFFSLEMTDSGHRYIITYISLDPRSCLLHQIFALEAERSFIVWEKLAAISRGLI
jgi:hypothetical protein